jgi:hypothetical protein
MRTSGSRTARTTALLSSYATPSRLMARSSSLASRTASFVVALLYEAEDLGEQGLALKSEVPHDVRRKARQLNEGAAPISAEARARMPSG